MKKLFLSAVLAGMMIASGGIIYLACLGRGQQAVGAVLFSVGLFTVCVYGLALFTGRVGYLTQNPPRYMLELIVIWLGNAVGTLLCGLAARIAMPAVAQMAEQITQDKLMQQPVQTILLGVLCGVLMYIAVEHFRADRTATRFIGIFLCVPAFILAGFEHCVADLFYFSAGAAQAQVGACLLFTLCATLGNSLGAILLPLGKASNICG